LHDRCAAVVSLPASRSRSWIAFSVCG
jgi:hypothetical protein